MTWDDVLNKAQTFNLMVSNQRVLGGGTVMYDLVFASSCLADQFADWAIDWYLCVQQETNSPALTVWGV